MKFKIKHEIKGRLRIHFFQKGCSFQQADCIQYGLEQEACVQKVKVYAETADAVIYYSGDRAGVIALLQKFYWKTDQTEIR